MDHGIWEGLLSSVSKRKDRQRKTLILLSEDSIDQTFVIKKLSQVLDSNQLLAKNRADRNQIANDFGLGYTFIEYKDENDDSLSHLDIYTVDSLQGNQEHYRKLIDTMVETQNIENILVVPILSIERDPSKFLDQLVVYLRFAREVFVSEDHNHSIVDQFKHNTVEYFHGQSLSSLKLKPGECDLPLGVNVLITVIHSDQLLKVQQSSQGRYNMDTFEYIQQVLRTIALKHGGSLAYITNESTKLLPLVARIVSLDTNYTGALEPNLINQNELLIPAGYDTIGKITTVNEKMEIAAFSEEWGSLLLEKKLDENNLVDSYKKTVKTKENELKPTEGYSSDQMLVTDFNQFLAENHHKSQSSNVTGSNETTKTTSKSATTPENKTMMNFFENLKSKNQNYS